MTDTYREYHRALHPTWARNAAGLAWADTHGDAKDALITAAQDAVAVGMAHLAPADALPRLGADARIPRLPDEADADYRDRIAGAWESHGWVGTVWGMVYALKLIGVPSRPIAQRRWATAPDGRADLWARWWIHIPLGAITVGSVALGSGWTVGSGVSPYFLLTVGGGWKVGDGSTVGSTATVAQIDAIRRQFARAKSARDRVEAVFLGEHAVYVGLDGLSVGAFVVGEGPTIAWRRPLTIGGGWIVGNETSGTGPWWPRVGHDFIV